MDRGAWWAIVHGVSKSATLVKRLSKHFDARPSALQSVSFNHFILQQLFSWIHLLFSCVCVCVCVCVKSLSPVRLFVTLWTVAR